MVGKRASKPQGYACTGFVQIICQYNIRMLLVEMFSYFSWHVRFAGFPEKQHDDTEYMRERRKYSK